VILVEIARVVREYDVGGGLDHGSFDKANEFEVGGSVELDVRERADYGRTQPEDLLGTLNILPKALLLWAILANGHLAGEDAGCDGDALGGEPSGGGAASEDFIIWMSGNDEDWHSNYP
jgi:hypothetical protein